jgi:hypothetical protein
MQKVAPDFTAQRGDGALRGALAGARPAASGGVYVRALAWLHRATDAQVALLIAVVLFGLAAWPVALVEVPPLQDLPNHLAAATIIQHLERYPELVFNGYLKTNSALFTWLRLIGPVLGLRVAARLFVLVVLALGAIALPRFVLAFGGRRRMVVAAFCAWPMVHNWFVSMGMLDFALGVPLATLLLVAVQAQRQRPTVKRGLGVALLAIVTWHAHVFPLLVVGLLVLLEVILGRSWAERRQRALAIAWPFLPASALVAVSLWAHFTEPTGAMSGNVELGQWLPPWRLVYHLWAEWFYGFTWLEITTLVPCLGLGIWAIVRCRDDVPLFGPVAFAALAVLYFSTPFIATNWFHVNSRLVPFLWLAALVRLPERLPRRAYALLGACAVAYSVGMGCDYVRLERDWARFTAGMGAVPEGSRLLPLVFRAKGVSENTRSLLHAWGFYVVGRLTSAPLLFAHSRSFPLMYREPPPPQFNHLVLESFAPNMASADWTCGVLRSGGIAVDDCEATWRALWADFWRKAEPAFDHVLMWHAPAGVLALVPPAYRVSFQRDELVILERVR